MHRRAAGVAAGRTAIGVTCTNELIHTGRAAYGAGSPAARDGMRAQGPRLGQRCEGPPFTKTRGKDHADCSGGACPAGHTRHGPMDESACRSVDVCTPAASRCARTLVSVHVGATDVSPPPSYVRPGSWDGAIWLASWLTVHVGATNFPFQDLSGLTLSWPSARIPQRSSPWLHFVRPLFSPQRIIECIRICTCTGTRYVLYSSAAIIKKKLCLHKLTKKLATPFVQRISRQFLI
jgi:hypothetical protein